MLAVIDYGAGNLRSVLHALKHLNAPDLRLAQRPEHLQGHRQNHSARCWRIWRRHGADASTGPGRSAEGGAGVGHSVFGHLRGHADAL